MKSKFNELVTGVEIKQQPELWNETIEIMLNGCEEQYYWLHRRFKTRPDGEKKLYPEKIC